MVSNNRGGFGVGIGPVTGYKSGYAGMFVDGVELDVTSRGDGSLSNIIIVVN